MTIVANAKNNTKMMSKQCKLLTVNYMAFNTIKVIILQGLWQ